MSNINGIFIIPAMLNQATVLASVMTIANDLWDRDNFQPLILHVKGTELGGWAVAVNFHHGCLSHIVDDYSDNKMVADEVARRLKIATGANCSFFDAPECEEFSYNMFKRHIIPNFPEWSKDYWQGDNSFDADEYNRVAWCGFPTSWVATLFDIDSLAS